MKTDDNNITYYESIEEVMENSRLYEVTKAMNILNFADRDDHTIEEVKKTIFLLYGNCIDSLKNDKYVEDGDGIKTSKWETGAFSVEVREYDETPNLIGVKFQISNFFILKKGEDQ
jgi:hypothetical protein